MMAAELDAGERREVDAVHYGANGGVVELLGFDVVLAEGLWWRGRARSELPTVSRGGGVSRANRSCGRRGVEVGG
jgi:hypothetical protein